MAVATLGGAVEPALRFLAVHRHFLATTLHRLHGGGAGTHWTRSGADHRADTYSLPRRMIRASAAMLRILTHKNALDICSLPIMYDTLDQLEKA
jgi:hypothetical protein